jgi:2-dehydro-3-deoxygluconokinase
MRVAVIGECMLEISNAAAGQITREMPCKFNFGGDTLNTAVYMARLGADVTYFTALGDDVYSEWLRKEWSNEGVDTSSVSTINGAMPGLYMIQTDAQGERSFSYWRENSAAKQWLQNLDELPRLLESLANYQVLYVSGITLSLMSNDYFYAWLDGIKTLRQNGLKLAFDINYRPRGWSSAKAARERIDAVLGATDIGLPTWDDEVLLYLDGTPQETLSRYALSGVEECVVKLGASGAICAFEGRQEFVPTVAVNNVIDSTGAGDSFNGGYLAKRFLGAAVDQACRAGHSLAGSVIQHRGAIIDLLAMPKVG